MSQTQSRTDQLVAGLEDFLRRYCHEDILQLANENGRTLPVEVVDLYRYDPAYVDDFLKNPQRVQDAFDEALHNYDIPADVPLHQAHVRLVGWSEDDVSRVGGYTSKQIGETVPVRGQIAKVTQPSPSLDIAVFVCQRCGAETVVPQPGGGEFQDPYQCESCERQGPFQLDEEQSEWRDIQTIRIQQPPEEVSAGAGATVDAVVFDDLVKQVEPGDRATVAGSLKVQGVEDSPEFQIRGHSVQIEDRDYDDATIAEHKDEILEIINGERGDPYELLVDSIGPRIHGEEYDEIKLALGLQLFGANEIDFADGSNGRGQFHVLLLGDPGVGKSELVEAVDDVAPRSVFTSGEGVSKVGLTASVVPDDFGAGKWSLEAGPIVKANDGICCVDEIDKAPEEAVEGLHTALEKQIVSVSKASFTGVELQAKTSLLAAGNPKYGRFDPYEPVPEQIDLSPTLLSRFDLLFMMSDQPDPDRDASIIRKMIQDRQDGILYNRGDIDAREAESSGALKPELVRSWVAYVHERDPQPVIEDEGLKDRITEFITGLRESAEGEDLDNQVPVTFRKVEGIERLAEASARVRMAETVSEEDVRRAVQLVLRSMRDVEYDPETGMFDADIKETGESRSQKERKRLVKTLIQEMQGSSGGVPIDDVVAAAVEEGYSDEKVRHDIETWKMKTGDVYEPADGEIRWVDL
ncbi:MAG: minichromosome maintenance protein MCM [Halodesulfurarchaeum sp.]